MGMLGCVVLLILGALAAEETLLRLRPGLRFYIQFFAPLSGHLGVIGALYGLYITLYMLAYLGFVRFAPSVYLTGLASGLTCLMLGLIFGRKTAERWLGEGLAVSLLRRAEPLERYLGRYRTALGCAGVVLAVIGLLLNILV